MLQYWFEIDYQKSYSFLSEKLEQQMTSVLGLGLGILFLVALFAAFGSKK
jgi:hypothetical protein